MKRLFICFCLLPVFAMGQSPVMKFDHLSMEDGLSQSSITCILKDSNGFMWFGTEDGLNKFDGSSFTIYQNVPNDNGSISNSYINTIEEREDGFIWVGTKNGLNQFDPNTEKFTRYLSDPNIANSLHDNAVSAIETTADGNLLVASTNSLQLFEVNRGFLDVYSSNNAYNRILSIAQDEEKNIWLLTAERLEKIKLKKDAAHEVLFEKPMKDVICNRMILDSSHLWIGTSKGILRLDLKTFESKNFRFYDPTDLLDKRNTILALTNGRSGQLWLGTNDGGLIDFNKATGEFQTLRNDPNDRLSLSSNSITNVFQDESGILWLGTYSEGINKYDPNHIQFKHYNHRNGDTNALSDKRVRSVLRASNGDLWVGTHGGLNRINSKKNKNQVYTYDDNSTTTISSNTVRSLAEDSKHTIWAGTWENGLNSFDIEEEVFTRYIHLPGEKDSLGPVRALAIDKSDHIWVGGNGLWRLDPLHKRTRPYLQHQKSKTTRNYIVRSLYFDSSDLLWVGTYHNGLSALNHSTGVTEQYLHDPKDSLSLSDNHVTCMVEDNKGLLWVGTYGGGLNVLDKSKGTFQRYNTSNGLLNDVIYGILIDDEDFVWFSSNAGLCRFDPKIGEFKYFGVESGIQSNEFNAGAFHKSKDGEFFFGGINGLNAFYPSTIYSTVSSKKIVFTEFQLLDEKKGVKNHPALNKAISRAEQITLNHDQNNFSLKFAELNYADNVDNNYEYLLRGKEKSWQNLGKNTTISIGNLKAGNYRLSVRVKNELSKQTSIDIEVLPPIWRTHWAYLIYILALVALAALTYRNIRNFQRTKRDFELSLANWKNNKNSKAHEMEEAGASNSKFEVKEVPTISRQQKFVERAIQIVEENIGDSSFGVERFMGEMFMSRSQLHRKIKAATGYSTTKFIRYIRLQRAAQLLKGGSGTVAEIAYKVGFENVGYFSKCFNETFGTPPSQYSGK